MHVQFVASLPHRRLEYFLRTPATPDKELPRGDVADDLHHLVVLVEEVGVDRKRHEAHVDRIALLNQQPLVRRERLRANEPARPLPERPRDLRLEPQNFNRFHTVPAPSLHASLPIGKHSTTGPNLSPALWIGTIGVVARLAVTTEEHDQQNRADNRNKRNQHPPAALPDVMKPPRADRKSRQ